MVICFLIVISDVVSVFIYVSLFYYFYVVLLLSFVVVVRVCFCAYVCDIIVCTIVVFVLCFGS